MTGRALILAVLIVALITPAAHAQVAGLEIVQPEEVAFTATSDADPDAVSVWVESTTSESVTPEFSLVVEDEDGGEIDGLSVEAEDAASLEPGKVGRYRLTLAGADSDTTGSGQLVVAADGVAPGSVPVSIASKPDLLAGADDPLWIPLFIATLLLVAGLIIANTTTSFGNPIPGVKIDFGSSFATTLTGLGALLGTVLGAGVLPDETSTLSSEAFAALSLLFGFAVVIAAAIPAVFQSDDGTNTIVGLFWVGAFITMWAVFGELITLWMLLGELGGEQGVSGAAATTFKVLLGIGAAAMLVYAPLRIARVTAASAVADGVTPGIFVASGGIARTPML